MKYGKNEIFYIIRLIRSSVIVCQFLSLIFLFIVYYEFDRYLMSKISLAHCLMYYKTGVLKNRAENM